MAIKHISTNNNIYTSVYEKQKAINPFLLGGGGCKIKPQSTNLKLKKIYGGLKAHYSFSSHGI